MSPTEPGYVEAPLAYDAVWSMALAINSTIERLKYKGKRIEEFTYEDRQMMTELKSAMENTAFQGLSSYVAFSTAGDRIAKILIEQLQDDDYVTVGYYDSQTDSLHTAVSDGLNASRLGIHHYRFSEKSGRPPKDRKLIFFQFWFVSMVLIVIVCLMSVLHAICSLSFLVVSNILSEDAVFHSSLPKFNSLILGGCILANVAMCIWGFANSSVTKGYGGPVLLHIAAFVESVGFTMAIGGMFIRTLVLRRVAPKTNLAKHLIKRQSLDTTMTNPESIDLFWYETMLLSLLIGFDVVFHILWPIVDPIQMEVKELPSEEKMSADDDDIFIRPRLFVYDCNFMTLWLSICLGEKSILLLAATFLAFDTRNLKHRGLTDAKFINLSIYNIAVFALITVPLTLLIKDKPTASFSFMSGAVLLCTWITLGLLLVPKIFTLRKTPFSLFEGQSETSSLNRSRGSLFRRKKPLTSVASRSTLSEDAPSTTGLRLKEDDSLKKLMAENEEIKRQISEKEARVAELREKLLGRLQNELLPHKSIMKEETVVTEVTSVIASVPNVVETSDVGQLIVHAVPNQTITNDEKEHDSLLTTTNVATSSVPNGAPTDTEISETYL